MSPSRVSRSASSQPGLPWPLGLSCGDLVGGPGHSAGEVTWAYSADPRTCQPPAPVRRAQPHPSAPPAASMPPPLSQLPGSLQVSGILPVLFCAGDQRARVQLSVTCARPQPRANGQRPDPHPASRPPFLQRQGPGPGAHAESSFPWGETAWPERDTCLLLESRGSSGQLLGKPLTVKKMTNEPLTQCLEAPDPAKEDGRPQSLRGGAWDDPQAQGKLCVCVCVWCLGGCVSASSRGLGSWRKLVLVLLTLVGTDSIREMSPP